MQEATLVLIISGAASGIGKALVEHFLAKGDSVFAVDIAPIERRHENLAAARVDVRDAAAWVGAVAACRDRFGGVDVLLNVAGYLRPGYAQEATAEHAALHLDVNVKGVIHGVQAVLPHFLERGAGHIVNIASISALTPVPGLSLYAASKWAVRGYTLSIAVELRPRGIAVSCICPDAVATPMLELQRDFPQAALTFSGAKSPLTADDVVRAVDRALRTKKLEILLPFGRGLLSKIGGFFPALSQRLLPLFAKKGLKQQSRVGS